MRNLKSVGVALLSSVGLAAIVGAPVAAATSKGLKITDVTVTAAKQSGYSAVSMSITDEAGSPVTLTQVTSSVSGMSMMYFDVNM